MFDYFEQAIKQEAKKEFLQTPYANNCKFIYHTELNFQDFEIRQICSVSIFYYNLSDGNRNMWWFPYYYRESA